MNPMWEDIIRGGSKLVSAGTHHALVPSEIGGRAMVFIHGFTSHGSYMKEMTTYARAHGFVTALYNYDSYLGIDRASASLRDRLELLSKELSQHGYILVGHSMGGLVALDYACNAGRLSACLKAIVLLGVPNAGTLTNGKLLRQMLAWGESITGPNPYFRSRACRSSLQLTRNDKERFLENLSESVRQLNTPILSFSGGKNALNFGSGRYAGVLRNRALQRLIGEIPNDGLVGESSADPRRAFNDQRHNHQNSYTDFPDINHTALTENQQVYSTMINWLISNFQ
jgi:pimeloyl-ACP methyl ester carboxylesterase